MGEREADSCGGGREGGREGLWGWDALLLQRGAEGLEGVGGGAGKGKVRLHECRELPNLLHLST